MRILLSGANGLIGSRVVPYLVNQGNDVTRLVRRSAGNGEIQWDPDAGTIDAKCLEGFDGVVHLASMSWAARWTPQFKAAIRRNRLATNTLLARTLAGCKRKPKVLICASGIGIYAPHADLILTESSPIGTDFLANLQCEGEASTAEASAAGIRVVHLRIPMVLGGETIQRRMGRLGSGRQWSSWIARDELASIIQFVLVTDSLHGPVNPTSPNPVQNAELAEALARVHGGRSGLPMPAFLLRALFGEMAEALILASRRAIPRKLLDAGYQFRFADVETALRHEMTVA